MDWNARYDTETYLYGTEPSDFLRREAGRLASGQTALCVADGEGRNSVFLAGQGVSVTAWDSSPVALEKARALAAQAGQEIRFLEADAATFDWHDRQYDAVIGNCIQFAPPPLRDRIFAGMIAATRPGGLILLHGYTVEQLALGTGGPSRADQLYTPELLHAAFGAEEILRLAAYEAEISEGSGHHGRSALIDLVVRRRSTG